MTSIDAIASNANTRIVLKGNLRLGMDAIAALASAAGGDALVVTANRNEKLTLQRLIDGLAADGSACCGTPRILTQKELCEEIFSACKLQELLGRSPLVLLPHEYDLLVEDVETIGLNPKRLKEMLKFFQRSITERAHRADNFFVSDEERQMFGLMSDYLKERKAIMACELGELALECIEGAGIPAALSGKRIFCTRYSALDKASQLLLAALEPQQLVCSCIEGDAGVPCIPFPYPEGTAELAEAGAAVFELPASCAQAPVVRALRIPAREQKALVLKVREWLDSGIEASDVLICAPSRSHAIEDLQALSDAGIEAQLLAQPACTLGKLSGPKSRGLRAFAALGLAAKPQGVQEWRTWLGFDDALTCSDTWMNLRKLAEEDGVGIIEEMLSTELAEKPRAISEATLYSLNKPISQMRNGAFIADNAAALTGSELRATLAQIVDDASCAHLNLGSDESAASAYERLREQAYDPVPSGTGVVVACVDDAWGLIPQALFSTNMVEGFWPRHEACDDMTALNRRARLTELDRVRFNALVQSSNGAIQLSYAKTADYEDAAREKLEIAHIYVDEHERKAELVPCRFMESLENGSKASAASTQGKE